MNKVGNQKQLNSRKLGWLVAESKESMGLETAEQQKASLARSREQDRAKST